MVQIIVSLLLVLAAGAGFTGTLYAAQDDLPGQTLYPLKTWSEDIQVALTVDPARQVELLIHIVQRRVEEAIALDQAGRVPPETVLQRMEEHFYQAMERAAAQGDEQMMRTLARVAERLSALQQILLDTPETPVREYLWTRLEVWLHLVQMGESDPVGFRQQIREWVQESVPAPIPPPGLGPGRTPEAVPAPIPPPGLGPGQTPEAVPAPIQPPGLGPGQTLEAVPAPIQPPGLGPGQTPEAVPAPIQPPGLGPGQTPEAAPPGPPATPTARPAGGSGGTP